MLQEIRLENFIVFESAEMALEPGLTVLSGETGAGKSLLIKALTLTLGERSSTDVLRQNTERARLSTKLLLQGQDGARVASLLGITPKDSSVTFERTIRSDGRSRLLVNGKATNLATVRDASVYLIDIAAQHEYTRLMDPAYQRELLDRHGGLLQKRDRFAESFSKAASLQKRLHAGDAERTRVMGRLEQIREDLDRLAELNFDPESDGVLHQRIDALSHAETIRDLCTRAIESLYEGDDAVQDRLGELLRDAETLTDCCPDLGEAVQGLANISAGLDEAVRCFRSVESSMDTSPEELDNLVERSEQIKRVARRLGCTPEELPETESALRREEEELSDWTADTGKIRKQLESMLTGVVDQGIALRESRIKAARQLAKQVNQELVDLDMPDAGFSIEVAPLWSKDDPPEDLLTTASSAGLEEVVFRLSANPGEPAAALSESASGGEMSRAMLAIKAALAEVHCPPILVFDEIDAGVGGRLGDTMARKLKSLARTRQVLVITHTPQIAAIADTHLRVSKHVRGKRTFSTVDTLSTDERIEEVAQMIRGKESTAVTRKQAEEMLRATGATDDTVC